MTLADRIKNARKAKKYTQKDLAKLLNVKSTTVSGWELGRNEPSINTLKKMAKVLNVNFDYLVGLNGSKSDYSANADLDEILGNARSFDGKPMSEHDKDIIRGYLEGYFQNK